MSPRQIVVDTNVVLSGLRSRQGASYLLLANIGVGDEFQIHLSVPLVLEYEEVLKREVRSLGLTHKDIDQLIDYYCGVAGLHDVYYLWRPFLPDPEDDMVLELALAANCDSIVTHNVRDFRGIPNLGLRAISPRHFLKEIGLLP